MGQDTRASRLAAAQRALVAAEANAGLRQRLVGVTTLATATSEHPHETPSGALPPELLLPVPPGLEPLLPWGGLRRGGAVQVSGSRSMLLAVAAAASRPPGQDLWCAVVAMPDVGLAAAAEAGLDLDRTVVVPAPGPDAPAVLGALIDGFDVVVLGRCPALTPADLRTATTRLRTREAVLLTTEAWPGALAVLTVGERSWQGVGTGEGVLTGREVTVTASARGMAVPRSVRVSMTADGRLSALPDAPARRPVPHDVLDLDLARAG